MGNDFLDRHGHRNFVFGEGRISGYASAALGIGALLGVLCFRFPEYLTTADMRANLYTFEFARNFLWLSICVGFLLGVVSYILNPEKKLALTGVTTAFVAVLLGAFQVQERAVEQTHMSFGLDWFVLALVFSMMIFIPLEKAFAQKPLKVLRPHWRTDLVYFLFSHLLIQFYLFATNYVHEDLLGWAQADAVQQWAQGLPIPVQILCCVLIADFFQAVTHKWYHEFGWLWKFHAVHHSSEHLDWLAGSRTHFVESLVTRTVVIVPLYIVGFATEALNVYVVIIGVQAVFVHANVSWDFGFLKYVIVTPQYHHWHHSDDPQFANTNYAVHLPVIDMLLGTFKLPATMWPPSYGVFDSPPPDGFLRQLLYPFRKSRA